MGWVGGRYIYKKNKNNEFLFHCMKNFSAELIITIKA